MYLSSQMVWALLVWPQNRHHAPFNRKNSAQHEENQMMIGRALCRADGMANRLAGQLVWGFPRLQLETGDARKVEGKKKRESTSV